MNELAYWGSYAYGRLGPALVIERDPAMTDEEWQTFIDELKEDLDPPDERVGHAQN